MNLHRLEIQVMNDEGFRAEPYRDSLGFWTIGYGSRSLLGTPVDENTGRIRSDQGRIQLRADLYRAILDAEELFLTFRALDDVRAEVLVNMAYNLGHKGLSRFVRLRAAVDRGDYQAAGDEMVSSRWFDQVGNRSHRLTMAMRTGRWSAGSTT